MLRSYPLEITYSSDPFAIASFVIIDLGSFIVTAFNSSAVVIVQEPFASFSIVTGTSFTIVISKKVKRYELV